MKHDFNDTSTFKKYQQLARLTAIYPDVGNNYTYITISLAGEVGEISGKIKKVIRDKGGIIDEETKKALSFEIGDVQWYLSNLASELGLDLQDIAKQNLEKLFSRMERGKLQGSGDDR